MTCWKYIFNFRKFEVNSSHFPGKTHKWELAHFLQKGYKNINNTFFNDMSKALYLLVITAKNRFCSRSFSILEGFKSWSRGFVDLMGNISALSLIFQSNLKNNLILKICLLVYLKCA